MLRLAAGPALAALLLVAGGGVVTGIVAGSFGRSRDGLRLGGSPT